jgi:DNA processing protein
MQERDAWLAFNHVRGAGAVRFRKLLGFFGTLAMAWEATDSALKEAGMTEKLIQAFRETKKSFDPVALQSKLDAKGIKVLTWLDENYPPYLKQIAQPPPVLYYLGEITKADNLAMAIVGTRNVTSYGKQLCKDTAKYLAGHGVTIVSGLARGVDAIAHHAALEMGGRTIAVLGSGVDVIYPPEHRKLVDAIVKSGAVMSDYAPGTKPDGINFPPRNRIISGLSRGTIVIEAGERSGALITAKFAVEQGRDVFAVPGSVLSLMSKGTNNLIGQGAIPMTNPATVVSHLGIEKQKIATQQPKSELSSLERRIYQALGSGTIHVDELCAKLDMPIEKMNATLMMMQLKGLVAQENNQEYRAVKAWQIG